MIVVTGAAGFIGSCLVSQLNKEGHDELILVDDFSSDAKDKNLAGKAYIEQIQRESFIKWLDRNHREVTFIFHLGARTDTAETDVRLMDKLNLNFSKSVWSLCVLHKIPLIYASSAATYGAGEHGYSDDPELIHDLKPLNVYGRSKHLFDLWAMGQKRMPPFWAGFKFFNVYGPNEYHKGRMASVIFHAYNQIQKSGKMKLFRSHRDDFEDGKQRRDFIYVKDVLDVLLYFMNNRQQPGVYNLGTGKSRTFLDLTNSTFQSMGVKPDIKFIDTPEDIRDKYQYFTEAKMEKLREAGYTKKFTKLEDGIEDYVKNYLSKEAYF